MLFIFLGIFVLSLALAVRSMKDFILPYELQKVFKRSALKGTIMFLRGGARHYKK